MHKNYDAVVWDPAMSVGQPRLDYDHKLFIGFFNEMMAHADADVHSEFISGFPRQIHALCGRPFC